MGSSRLHGKVALVAGGGQGVGRGIATALAADGAALVSEDFSCMTGQTLMLTGDA